MVEIVVYSTNTCPYCDRAKMLLNQEGVSFTEIRVDLNPELRDEMIEKSGRQTVPQIFINGQAIGGFDDLYALKKQGKLTNLLKG